MGRMINLDYVHTMPTHFENVANVTVAKFELAFRRCQNNLTTVGYLTVKNLLQNFHAKEMCLRPKNKHYLRRCSILLFWRYFQFSVEVKEDILVKNGLIVL